MQVWAAALNEKTNDNDEIKGLEDFEKHTDETEVPLAVFVTRWDVIAMVPDETKKATATMMTETITGMWEDTVAGSFKLKAPPNRKGVSSRYFASRRKANWCYTKGWWDMLLAPGTQRGKIGWTRKI